MLVLYPLILKPLNNNIMPKIKAEQSTRGTPNLLKISWEAKTACLPKFGSSQKDLVGSLSQAATTSSSTPWLLANSIQSRRSSCFHHGYQSRIGSKCFHRYSTRAAPHIISTEAVKHFKDSNSSKAISATIIIIRQKEWTHL